ncbi:hypothetical protein GYMLUDRAFT_160707, partial [Collybiopsis luxurians FD-317 M1]
PEPEIVDRKFDAVGSEVEFDTLAFPLPNPTLFPDRLVAKLSPVIVIRNPMFVYPSWVRAVSTFGGTVDNTESVIVGKLRWQRIIYDFYRAYYDETDPERHKDWPIVIDGDKLVENPEGQMKKFCDLVGLTESGIQYSWESSDSSNRYSDRVLDAFFGTIKESKGVIRENPLKVPSLEEQVKKWTAEWNVEVAQKMKEAVISALEDYEYLRARCL